MLLLLNPVLFLVVHNSVPNDRIQLAKTCKYMNEAVKRAKPKKIVEDVTIDWRLEEIFFRFDSKVLRSPPSPEFFTSIRQILQQIQVEKLRMVTNSLDVEETQDSGLFRHLFEASKFVTELNFCLDSLFSEFTEFYNRLEHLEFLDFGGSIEMFN
uniref:Uncharacterized protein n=1 Tax=Panagrolaimus sp. JU765 TaxID=591449 RepID=A0AC34RGQ3_9BILA